ncbi:MAG: VOC family protein [Candidatus Poribacteria bacterium]|nr:VOC family protein [Candidatus Poribacteria bacterium]
MEYKFHHIHIRCQDLEASIDYYKKMFDGVVIEQVEVRGMTIARMKVGGENIFLSPKFGEAEVEPTTGNPRWGAYQLAFSVNDLESAVSDLENKGAKLENLRPNGLPLAFFSGPDGVQIELVGK